MKNILTVFLLFCLTFVFAQNKPAPTLKSILLEQLKTTQEELKTAQEELKKSQEGYIKESVDLNAPHEHFH